MTEFISPGTQFASLGEAFPMTRGGSLRNARLAFETQGTLNAAKDNAVLIATGLSPSAHVASTPDNPDAGWWQAIVGEGLGIDTRRFFVICVNSLGSCKGSTGAASIDPDTGQAYRLNFPDLAVEDVAAANWRLTDGFGITRLAGLVGCSMGGMTALAMLAQRPGGAVGHLNVSGAALALPFSIAVRSLQREAIRLDPAWNNGDYNEDRYPEAGMRIARKLGVVTYRSALEWRGRFGRVRLDADDRADQPFGAEFQVESYLDAQATRFVRRFDPNCYLYLSRAIDWFHLAHDEGAIDTALAQLGIDRAMAIGTETDILFPLEQQRQIAEGISGSAAQTEFVPLPSPQGHDAFLVDIDRFGPAISRFFEGL